MGNGPLIPRGLQGGSRGPGMYFCFSCLAWRVIAPHPPLTLPCWPVTTLEDSAWYNCLISSPLSSLQKREHRRRSPQPCHPGRCLGHFRSLRILIFKVGFIRDPHPRAQERATHAGRPHAPHRPEPGGRKICPGPSVGSYVALGWLLNLSVPLSSRVRWGSAGTFLIAGLW